MPKLLDILEFGHPTLVRVADPVTDVGVQNAALQELIDDMIHTCEHVGAVGIAAPQVGHSIRLFIIASKPTPRYPTAPLMTPMAVINPTFEVVDDTLVEGWEGCLSIPDRRGKVQRPRAIEVTFTTRTGEKEKLRFSDFVARVFLHEFDHIEGRLFTDIADPTSLVSNAEYAALLAAETSE